MMQQSHKMLALMAADGFTVDGVLGPKMVKLVTDIFIQAGISPPQHFLAASADDPTNSYTICVGSDFGKTFVMLGRSALKYMTKAELQGCIAHEVGHVALEHMLAGEPWNLPWEVNHLHEFAADEFAVTMGYGQGLRDALDRLCKFDPEMLDQSDDLHPSCRSRIQRLDEKIQALKLEAVGAAA